MSRAIDYTAKFEHLRQQPLFQKLDTDQQQALKRIAFEYRLTFQEFRTLVEASRDLRMWGEPDLDQWWREQEAQSSLKKAQLKVYLFQQLREYLDALKSKPARYPAHPLPPPQRERSRSIRREESDKAIMGMCPVASPQTVCCNLRTIDVVENCPLGCSYCIIQTFYQENIRFDAAFAEKLKRLELDPHRFYHIGTGQSSDSLLWDNRYGVLEAICQFAADHPHVLMELKTKSDQIRYMLENEIPPNVVCSWSLNTPTIIENEEHFTASLERRLAAARAVADKGIRVGFHFHPMIHYAGWEVEYPAVAQRLIDQFHPAEVVFISFGSLTLIKPAVKAIREQGNPTKILQTQFSTDPLGKLTYSDEIKIALFRTLYQAFTPWQEEVFFYLCMEKASIWKALFGTVYESNEQFEQEFGRHTLKKIKVSSLI
ncbi:MAG: DNA photolyase [Gemmatimonadetes bacterium]|nr:MAG: DNA photolyase [Gemmatimonadota bacterium]